MRQARRILAEVETRELPGGPVFRTPLVSPARHQAWAENYLPEDTVWSMSAESDVGPRNVVITRHGDEPVVVVAGGNHVTTLLAAETTEGALDAITVRADRDGGPRHTATASVSGFWYLRVRSSSPVSTMVPSFHWPS